jgi:hypothetical protein
VDELVFAGVGGRILKPVRQTQEVRSGERRPLWRATHVGGSITSLAVSPDYAEDRTVLVATTAGVFVSHDGAEHFESWRAGAVLPRIVALAVSPSFRDDRLVYGLGLGGTVWRVRTT